MPTNSEYPETMFSSSRVAALRSDLNMEDQLADIKYHKEQELYRVTYGTYKKTKQGFAVHRCILRALVSEAYHQFIGVAKGAEEKISIEKIREVKLFLRQIINNINYKYQTYIESKEKYKEDPYTSLLADINSRLSPIYREIISGIQRGENVNYVSLEQQERRKTTTIIIENNQNTQDAQDAQDAQDILNSEDPPAPSYLKR